MAERSEMDRSLKIGIIGLGMVGEPIKRWFEEKKGFKRKVNLFCYDSDPTKGYFDDYNSADVVFVAVPTPPNPDGSCNISIVESVATSIKGEKVIIIKSTVPPGTTQNLQDKFPQHKFLFNPEFLTESQAWEDFLKPVRQIVGYTEKSKDVALFVLNLLPASYYQSPWMVSTYVIRGHTTTEAEVVKYASNVFGASKVSFGNMIYDVCDGLQFSGGFNVSYENVRDALGADPRIGPAWLDVNHGSYRGFGGYCFPKDLNAFIQFIARLEQFSRDEPTQDRLAKMVEFLMSIWNYNETLLRNQNLSVEDVSKHDKGIIVKKIQEIT